MNKLMVALCVIIIVKDSGYLAAQEQNATRDNSMVVLHATQLMANLLKAAGMKKDENATPRERCDAFAKIVEDIGVMAVLMTRSEKVKREFLRKLQDFFATVEGQEFLQKLKVQITLLELPTA